MTVAASTALRVRASMFDRADWLQLAFAISLSHSMPQKLPEYTYVPGVTPHPISDPRGHWRQRAELPQSVPELLRWGLQLFNHGYYWEAHEIWEAAWVQLGRTGPDAETVKGFIKLAACGVKCLEGNSVGAMRHARRAQELLLAGANTSLSLNLDELPISQALAIARGCSEALPLANDSQREAARSGGVSVLGKLTELDDRIRSWRDWSS